MTTLHPWLAKAGQLLKTCSKKNCTNSSKFNVSLKIHADTKYLWKLDNKVGESFYRPANRPFPSFFIDYLTAPPAELTHLMPVPRFFMEYFYPIHRSLDQPSHGSFTSWEPHSRSSHSAPINSFHILAQPVRLSSSPVNRCRDPGPSGLTMLGSCFSTTA